MEGKKKLPVERGRVRLRVDRIHAQSPTQAGKVLRAVGALGALLPLVFLGPRARAQNPFRQHSFVYDSRPDASIPVYPLGYQPPGELPAFQYYSLVSLHYIDATKLLFAFNTIGLVHRDKRCSVQDAERRVRAMVIDIPSGKPIRQAEWKLYDFSNFLWALGNGQFLLRRCSQLERVDASLTPMPFINMGGSLVAMGVSPERSMVLLEEEPAEKAAAKPKNGGADPVLSQLADSMLANQSKPKLNLDFIRLHPLSVVARSQVPFAVDLPILPDGFLETMGASQHRWDIIEHSYQNAQRQVASLRSFCAPQLTAITDKIFLAQMCPRPDQMAYQGVSMQGAVLWQIPFNPDRVLPRFLWTQDGSHFAIETLHASHPRAALDPLNSESIDAEILDIYDTSTGAPIASLRITPVYTSGQNAAFSPDGTHIAVLRDGAIEIYSLAELEKTQQSGPR